MRAAIVLALLAALVAAPAAAGSRGRGRGAPSATVGVDRKGRVVAPSSATLGTLRVSAGKGGGLVARFTPTRAAARAGAAGWRRELLTADELFYDTHFIEVAERRSIWAGRVEPRRIEARPGKPKRDVALRLRIEGRVTNLEPRVGKRPWSRRARGKADVEIVGDLRRPDGLGLF